MPQEAVKSNKGFINFEYRIKDEENQIQKETLTINIIGLEDVFAITSDVFNPQQEKTTISIENKANLNFENMGTSPMKAGLGWSGSSMALQTCLMSYSSQSPEWIDPVLVKD